MKKVISIILLVIVLAGCSQQDPQGTIAIDKQMLQMKLGDSIDWDRFSIERVPGGFVYTDKSWSKVWTKSFGKELFVPMSSIENEVGAIR